MRNLRYPYKPNSGKMALVILLGAGCAAFFVHLAQTNDRGLIIGHTIELSPDDATIFFWCMAALFGLIVLPCVYALLIGLTSSKELVLTETELTAPANIFSREPEAVRI